MAMTARQVYEGTLIELNKVLAPSMLLEDFNYFINKAINQYINKKYNIYDVNQLSTDDLRVLKATALIDLVPITSAYGSNTVGNVTSRNSLFGGTYEGYMPTDYLHLLNCICNFKVKKQYKCYDKNTYVQFGAIRLTADLWSLIINNFYMKPSYKRPYYYLHNVNTQDVIPTNPHTSATVNPSGTVSGNGLGYGTDPNAISIPPVLLTSAEQSALTTAFSTTISNTTPGVFTVTLNSITYTVYYIPATSAARQIIIGGTQYNYSTTVELSLTPFNNGVKSLDLQRNIRISSTDVVDMVEREAGFRFGNQSSVRIEVRTGKDTSIFELENIYIDYVKAPQNIRLTQEQIDLTEDTSQMMEFPDYVCQEIINELTHLIMENSSDPRLQSHMPMTMSIANPAAQQLQPQQASQQEA